MAAQLKAAGLARSTFYYQLKALEAGDRYAGLKEQIRAVTTTIRAAMDTGASPRRFGKLGQESITRPCKG